MSVLSMTQTGTRLFCFSSLASRFFLPFDFLPIVAERSPPWLKFLSILTGSLPQAVGGTRVGRIPDETANGKNPGRDEPYHTDGQKYVTMSES